MTTRITIGMPVFNNAATLDRAITSVLNQTLPDWKLVISDDGSEDDSLLIAKRFAESDPRITCVTSPKRLGYMNFRHALKDAETDWVVWLAGDDYWAPRFLEATYAAAELQSDAVSVLPRWRYVGLHKSAPRKPPLDGKHRERVRRYLAAPGGTRMYGLTRRSAVLASFPKRNMPAYDWFLMLGLLAKGPQIDLPECLLFREITPLKSYVEAAARENPWLLRRWPVLRMSLAAIVAGRVPLANLPDLARLNLRKHEEHLALLSPAAFRRRKPLFKALGLPYASDAEHLASISDNQIKPKRETGSGRSQQITAILTCRNAEATVERCVRHLLWHGAHVIVIDNGSTDSTIDILRKFPELDLRHEPYAKAFDLTRQLRMKHQIIRDIGTGWIIHADVDEFLDTPDGQPLKEVLPLLDAPDLMALPVVELMFLPTSEDDCHDPDRFETTMQACVRMAERDPKQRVFRAEAPLSQWLATGGHTVTKAGQGLAQTALTLRHYPALSLDHARAQYLSRIFAPGDLGKTWHTNRQGVARRVTAPQGGVLVSPEEALSRDAVRSILVLSELPSDEQVDCETEIDLALLTTSIETKRAITAQIEKAFPGLRVGTGSAHCPKLGIFEHPARALGRKASVTDHAEHWLRTTSGTRQIGVTMAAPYADTRIETLEQTPEHLVKIVRDLLSGNAAAPRFAEETPIHRDPRFQGRLADITGPLARDLGYG